MAGWFGKMRRALGRLTGASPPSMRRGPGSPGAPAPAPARVVPFERPWSEQMTAGWLASTDPDAMLENLGERASERKVRLFSAACCRPLVAALDREWCRAELLALAERLADGPATGEDRRIRQAMQADLLEAEERADAGDDEDLELQAESLTAHALRLLLSKGWSPKGAVGQVAAEALSALAACGAVPAPAAYPGTFQDAPLVAYRRERVRQCTLLREVFGNPFLPKAFSPLWLAQNDGAAVDLARGIYEGQHSDEMPILADALEDAGCDDTDVLWHCRHGKGHVRGCWVVDAVLGKE